MASQQLIIDLDRLGYFRYLTDSQKKHIPRMLARLNQSGYFFVIKANRDYYADPKSLIKCGVKNFLRRIRRILKTNGVIIGTIEENCSGDGYSITINKQEYVIYSAQELQSPNREYWELTIRRSFAIINKLLKDVGSKERIFSTVGGDEEWAIFLTIELYDLLVQYGFIQVGRELFLYEDMNFDT
jgi:hypothetical protein